MMNCFSLVTSCDFTLFVQSKNPEVSLGNCFQDVYHDSRQIIYFSPNGDARETYAT